jgi:hypothetical protein
MVLDNLPIKLIPMFAWTVIVEFHTITTSCASSPHL